MAVSEESPLLTPSSDTEANQYGRQRRKQSDILIVYVAFLGVFIASADESLVISTYSAIASQFHRLKEGSWLLLAYNFGFCISLPIYSVLGDAYGRKNVLLASYLLFASSCLACGASSSITQLVLSRVLTGSSGAGMSVVVSVVLTDLIPADEIALFRGYQNVVNVAGRSLGAPIGGFLADTVGWRWSFYGQFPLILMCMLFAMYRLPSSLNDTADDEDAAPIRDLDFAGIVVFSATVLVLLFLLRALGAHNQNMFLQTSLLSLAFVSGCAIFLVIELFWATKPLIPVRLLSQSIGGWFVIQILLLGGRFALISNLVPYFIRVEKTSDFTASLSHVVVAAGVSVGGVVSGLVIKHTKRLKSMTLAALCTLLLVYLLIFIQWRNGFALWQGIYLLALGFAPGVLFPALFVGMASTVPEGMLSVCIGTYYLCQQLGLIIGPSCGSALSQRLFARGLWEGLGDVADKNVVVNRILNEVRFADSLPLAMQEVVRSSYLDSFRSIPLFSIVTTTIIVPILVLLKEPFLG
ncbi:major facilitator superfamily domain-containing protein [Aspergillus cavernicola]|uniref:Major facilitator superfamily domain-containing protein n=1 Tax=Aspergillus cavernicola TaxID=176166 RepID=A0ABR4IBB8_9EURO